MDPTPNTDALEESFKRNPVASIHQVAEALELCREMERNLIKVEATLSQHKLDVYQSVTPLVLKIGDVSKAVKRACV